MISKILNEGEVWRDSLLPSLEIKSKWDCTGFPVDIWNKCVCVCVSLCNWFNNQQNSMHSISPVRHTCCSTGIRYLQSESLLHYSSPGHQGGLQAQPSFQALLYQPNLLPRKEEVCLHSACSGQQNCVVAYGTHQCLSTRTKVNIW